MGRGRRIRRFTIFQSKKGKTSPSSLRSETHTKSSQGTAAPVLSEALVEIISNSGAYVIVTPTAVVGTKVDRRVQAIAQGIRDTGNDPTLLSSIHIYDCNRLAAWTNTHPSVALWLNAALRDVHLGGFQSFQDWARSPDICEIPFQNNDDKRFVAKGSEIQTWRNDDALISQEKSFEEIREVISTFLLTRGSAIRVIGPSGYGKTRFVHQLVASETTLPQDVLGESQIVYCLYDDVKDQLSNITREIADSQSRVLLIVDDCPDEAHTRLSEIVRRDGSRCHLITIGVETTAHGMRSNLIIELNPASDALIGGIAEATSKQVSEKNSSLIRDLSQGFPRMAVFASRALEDGDPQLISVETLVSRIVWGEHERSQSAFESLQLLSLFTIVGMENTPGRELGELAAYCGKAQVQLFREVAQFVERGVVVRHGDYAEVQPLPLAMRLANQWLESNPAGTLENLYRSLSEDMKLKMVGRLRWVSWSDKVSKFGRALLSEELPNEAALDSESGSKLLDRLVHLAPDAAMDHLDRLLSDKTIDELEKFDSGRRNTIWALEKLVFRRQTFDPAARLLLRLGAAENERWANNASSQFKSLYQLHLSGTEATPEEKMIVLDDGLANTDERIRKLCVEALDRMLETWHFSRSGGSEHIGSGEALEDWSPKTYGEIFDFHRAALSRLGNIAVDINDPNCRTALNIIGSHLRGLFSIVPMIDEIQALITRLRNVHPNWYAATLQLNSWLFFDRDEADEAYQIRLREYYDQLVPTDPLEQIYFYSSGWSSEIHDPDIIYDPQGDFEHSYGQSKIYESVDAATLNAAYFLPLLDRFLHQPTNSAWIAVIRIASHVDQPDQLLRHLLTKNENGDIATISNLARNIVFGATQKGRDRGLECLELALAAPRLSASSIDFLSAVGLDDALMRRAIGFVQNETVTPQSVSSIGYSDILEKVDHDLIEALVDTLLTKQLGAWAVIEFLSSVLYRSDPKDDVLLHSRKAAVVNRALFDQSPSNMGWYHWCELVKSLVKGGHVNDQFSAELLDFIISVTTVEEYSVQLAFDDYAQKILRRLIANSPGLVWEKYHQARSASDRITDYRLRSLFGAKAGEPSDAGVLNDIPAAIYVPWMLEEKAERMPFILEWLQLFVGDKKDRQWNPEFVKLIDTHVDRPERLDGLRTRLTTGVWWGSYATKLEGQRDQLSRLRGLLRNPAVHRWIDRTVSVMEQQISEESRRDANREASSRA